MFEIKEPVFVLWVIIIGIVGKTMKNSPDSSGMAK